jgi:hypothetical protein
MKHGLPTAALLPIAMIGPILIVTGCASPIAKTGSPPAVTVLDNLGGASRPSVVRVEEGADRIEVPSRFGDCVLKDFLVKPERTLPSQVSARDQLPEEFQADRAIYRFRPSMPTTIIAQYVHTILVESGSRSEPEGETHATGSGEMQAGRVLLNGYRFDHYEFSSDATGPGGAWASVKEAPRPGGEQTYLRIRWFYDSQSRVSFSWKIYATGPCNAPP